jgi:ketosteroid isomerase-like protein
MPTVEVRLTQAYRDMAAGDIDRLMDLYEQDALIQSSGERPIAGIINIRTFWQTIFDRYQVQLVPKVDEVTTFGEIVIVRGRAVGRFAPKDGQLAMPIDSWFMQIYRRRADGTLRFWRGANGPSAAAASGEVTR